MGRLVYGAHALRCMLAGDRVLLDWVEQEPHDIFTTCIALGRMLDAAERLVDTTQRRNWTNMLRDDVPAMFGPRLLPFGYDAAIEWSGLRAPLVPHTDFDEHELMDVAVATINSCSFIAPHRTWHPSIGTATFIDPWTTSTSPPSATPPGD